MSKGKIACYKQFLLSSQCFLQLYIFVASKCSIVWEWVKQRYHRLCMREGPIKYESNKIVVQSDWDVVQLKLHIDSENILSEENKIECHILGKLRLQMKQLLCEMPGQGLSIFSLVLTLSQTSPGFYFSAVQVL